MMSLNEKLNKAIRSGDADTARRSIHEGADINIVLGMQGTPLCAAISANQVDMVKFLIEFNCDVNGRDYDGETPLCLAIRKNIAMVEMLIKAGCRVNREDPISKQPPIIIATKLGFTQVVQWLVDANCDVNKCDDNGSSALHHAIAKEKYDIMSLLLKAGTKVNMRNKTGNAPIHLAASASDLTALKILIDTLSVDIDQLDIKDLPQDGKISHETIRKRVVCDVDKRNQLDDNTALHIAVMCNNVEAVELLLDAGCNVNAMNNEYITPLGHACLVDNRILALALLDRGAHVNPEKNLSTLMRGIRRPSATPLHMAARNADVALVKKLLECGARVNAQNTKGETPLYLALKNSSHAESDAVVDCILNREDVDFTVLTFSGYTLYHALLNTNRLVDISKLVKHGCPINRVPNLPLHHAVDMEYYYAIEELLKQGANPNLVNENDMTALHVCALDQADIDIAKLLISYGADVNAIKDGETSIMPYALYLALSNCDEPLIHVLVDAGCNLDCLLPGNRIKDEDAMENIDIAMEDEPELYSMLKTVAMTPRSLCTLSCLSLRHYFISNDIKISKVDELCLPPSLKDFITMKFLFKIEKNSYHVHICHSSKLDFK